MNITCKYIFRIFQTNIQSVFVWIHYCYELHNMLKCYRECQNVTDKYLLREILLRWVNINIILILLSINIICKISII